MSRWRRWAEDGQVIGCIYAVATFIASAQKYWHGSDNNLRIFRASFWNLLARRDLYGLHPAQHADYFKYSPTFALLMAPFAAMPEFVSAILWNLCNVFALFAAVQLLKLERRQKALVLWLVLIEVITSIQNFQSNLLVAALIIATLVAFEHDLPELAGLFVALGASIKVFGAAAALLALFYPRKFRFVAATVLAVAVLAALPLTVTSLTQLEQQYRSWFALLGNDYLAQEKLSIMAWLRAWFRVDWPNLPVQIAGLCLLLVPLTRIGCYRDHLFRLCFVSSLLIFLVIFNHKAESPMFILAVSGVAIWFAASEHNVWRTALVVLVLLFTSLISTDLVPRYWRETWTTPLVVKAVACILAWFVIEIELLFRRCVDS